jgi:ankyrin repeat protein
MRQLRSVVLSAVLVLSAAYSGGALADHPTFAVAILEQTESPVNRQVIDLVNKKDFKQLQALASKGEVKQADYKGVAPIHLAAYMGSAEAVKILLKAGVDPKASTFGGWTALHYAAFAGQSAVAELLLAAGVPVDARDTGGESPMFYAIETGNLEMVQWLVAHGADVNHTTNHGETPLAAAMENEQRAIVEYLQKLGAK